jgi:hypothetical protein
MVNLPASILQIMQTIVTQIDFKVIIMDTIAGAIDGEVRSKIDRSTAIDPNASLKRAIN